MTADSVGSPAQHSFQMIAYSEKSDDDQDNGDDEEDNDMNRDRNRSVYSPPQRCWFCVSLNTVSAVAILGYPETATDRMLGSECMFCFSSLLAFLRDFPARSPLHARAVLAFDEVEYCSCSVQTCIISPSLNSPAV